MHRALLGTTFALLALGVLPVQAQHVAEHERPDRLGEVSFPISCSPAVQKDFNRGVALLHSFSYASADQVFRSVAQHDSLCAIAHWGLVMTEYHQLWEAYGRPSEWQHGADEIQRHASGSRERRAKRITWRHWTFSNRTRPARELPGDLLMEL